MNKPRPIKFRRWARASSNGELLRIDTHSGYGSRVLDAHGPHYDFRPDVSDDALGAAVLDCLNHSRFLDTAALRAELYDYEVCNKNLASWVEHLMHFGGYKTRRALFKQMMSCSIEQEDDTITITPSHHEKLEGWSGMGFTEADNVVISASEPSAAIGAALREGLRRCT